MFFVGGVSCLLLLIDDTQRETGGGEAMGVVVTSAVALFASLSNNTASRRFSFHFLMCLVGFIADGFRLGYLNCSLPDVPMISSTFRNLPTLRGGVFSLS